MKKVIKEADIRSENNAERCKLILKIIKRTSSIYERYEIYKGA